jgi:hypothetical protein
MRIYYHNLPWIFKDFFESLDFKQLLESRLSFLSAYNANRREFFRWIEVYLDNVKLDEGGA